MVANIFDYVQNKYDKHQKKKQECQVQGWCLNNNAQYFIGVSA